MDRTEADRFEDGYYGRMYSDRRWRRRGDRPVLFRTIARKLRARKEGSLLDIGCGEGHLLKRVASGFDIYGVDISEAGIEAARANAPSASLSVASATALPFPDNCFSVACCLDVLEHLHYPSRAIGEAHRVLESSGLLLLSTPNPMSLGHRLKGRDSFIHRDPTHCTVRPPQEWRAVLTRHGFSIMRDGTDTLWDTPYLGRRAPSAQWLIFTGVSQLLWLAHFTFPWRWGENYVCLAFKR